VKLKKLRLTGFPAWLFWSVAHVYFLIGLRSRIAVAFTWSWDYATFGRRARLITEAAGSGPAEPREPSREPSAAEPAAGAGVAPAQGRIWG